MVYWPDAGSKEALPGTSAAPMSDWPVKTPMGVSKFLLGRWKSGGGATWACVAEPGCAQDGAAEGDGACTGGDCVCRARAATRASAATRPIAGTDRREARTFMATHCSRRASHLKRMVQFGNAGE